MYSYKEYNEPIQQLITLMRRDSPNGFELRINSFGGKLVNNQTVHCYVSGEAMKDCRATANLTMEEIQESLRSMEYNGII